jgi:hypothetical protein
MRRRQPTDKPQTPTQEELRKTVRSWDPNLSEDSPGFDAALVMLAALYVGSKDLPRLSQLTGVRPGRVRGFASNLRKARVWSKDGTTLADWDLPGTRGPTAFWCDVLIARGFCYTRRGENWHVPILAASGITTSVWRPAMSRA